MTLSCKAWHIAVDWQQQTAYAADDGGEVVRVDLAKHQQTGRIGFDNAIFSLVLDPPSHQLVGSGPSGQSLIELSEFTRLDQQLELPHHRLVQRFQCKLQDLDGVRGTAAVYNKRTRLSASFDLPKGSSRAASSALQAFFVPCSFGFVLTIADFTPPLP